MSRTKVPSSIRDPGARVVAALVDGEPIDVALRATLLIFLLGPNLLGLEWHYKLLFQIVSVVGLLAPAVGRSAGFWCVVTALMVCKSFDHWWMQDNHVFLLTWWCIAITIGLFAADAKGVIALNARVLIGLSFFFAVLWKGFLSPDYMSGEYFHYTFLTDGRFSQIGILLCGMTAEDYSHNYAAINQLANYTAEVHSVQLQGTDALRTLALVVTWWTVLIEGALAVLFLVPISTRLSRWRDAVLLLFAWTTYAAAPVKTFGWTLTTLGLAQCDRDARRTRFCYLMTYPLLLIYDLAPIWSSINGIAEWLLG
jgi:hypothetical protein